MNRFAMPRDHIQTDFMDRQAAENAKSGTARGFMVGIGIVVLVGIGFGGYHAFQFFSNFESNQFKRNVSVTLKEPKVVGGKAVVSVEMKNHNAIDISSPKIQFAISDKDSKPVASGVVDIDGTVPAADSRTFEQVSLAEIKGQPARMKSDLVSIVPASDKNLPKGFAARFAGAFEQNGPERIEALKPLADEVPNFDAGHIGIGLAYQEQDDWQNALEHYKKAVEIAPNSYNAHYHLGMALAREKKMPEAIAALKKATELNPGDQTISKSLASLTSPAKPAATDTVSDASE
jgi:hypothetical protein